MADERVGSIEYSKDGFTLNVKKTANTFAIKLVTKLTNITKSATVTVPELTDLESVYLIKAYAVGDTFTVTGIDNTIQLEAGKSTYLVSNITKSDYEVSMDVVGTKAAAVSSEVKYRFIMWYLDSNNYAEAFVEWQQWDRSFEIRSIQVRTVIGGTERKEIITIWGDNPNNNTLPADGFTLTVTKTGNTFAIKLVTKLTNVTKQGSVTLPEVSDLEARYAIKGIAQGDTFTVTNLKYTAK